MNWNQTLQTILLIAVVFLLFTNLGGTDGLSFESVKNDISSIASWDYARGSQLSDVKDSATSIDDKVATDSELQNKLDEGTFVSEDFAQEGTLLDVNQTLDSGVPIKGTTGGVLESDKENYLYTTSPGLGKIHEGKGFSVSKIVSVPQDTSKDFLLNITNPNASIHLSVYGVATDVAPGRTFLYEGTNVSSPGTEIVEHNNNREYEDNTSSIEVTEDPTVTSAGERIESDIITGDKQSGGGTKSVEIEWTLNSERNYMIRYNNTATSDATAEIRLYWYEHIHSD